jgi:hypothetical protein
LQFIDGRRIDLGCKFDLLWLTTDSFCFKLFHTSVFSFTLGADVEDPIAGETISNPLSGMTLSTSGADSSSELSSPESAQKREPFPTCRKLNLASDEDPTLEHAAFDRPPSVPVDTPPLPSESAKSKELTGATASPRFVLPRGSGANVSRRRLLLSIRLPPSLSSPSPSNISRLPRPGEDPLYTSVLFSRFDSLHIKSNYSTLFKQVTLKRIRSNCQLKHLIE